MAKQSDSCIGYCAVTADILHIGHIKFLERCGSRCSKLVVGVMTDKCVEKYKGKKPIMPYKDRAKIIKSLRMVHKVVPQKTFEFNLKELKGYKIFDSTKHRRKGAHIYIPYTKGVSSTEIKKQCAREIVYELLPFTYSTTSSTSSGYTRIQ